MKSTRVTLIFAAVAWIVASPSGAEEAVANDSPAEPAAQVADAADTAAARPVAEQALAPAATVARTGSGDLMNLESSAIRGNQELPKVLYIVPWKDPALGNLVGKPVNSLVDEVIAPVDREVFLRQTMYFDQLYANPDDGSE